MKSPREPPSAKRSLKPRLPQNPPSRPRASTTPVELVSKVEVSQPEQPRRWNTPKELQNLLFQVRPVKEKQPSSPPQLVQLPTETREGGGLASPKGRIRKDTTESLFGAIDHPKKCSIQSPSIVNRDSISSEKRRSLRRTDTVAMIGRVANTLDYGRGIALYSGLNLLSPGDIDTVAAELRINSNLLLFHEQQPDTDECTLNNALLKVPLTSILSAQIDLLSTSILLTVRVESVASLLSPAATHALSPRGSVGVQSSAARLSCFKTSATPNPIEQYEVLSDDPEQLEEILLCILHQQITAFHTELGRVRKSLKTPGTRVLDIVHFNDVYHLGVFKKEEPCGGVARFHYQLEELRRKKNPLVLFSGDFVGPSLMSVITKGKQMVDALNFLGTHYGVFGNHEFDFGLRNLERIIHGYTHGEFIFAGSNTEWLMTNMDGKDGAPLGGVSRSKLLEWNGIHVGIIGLCENWLPHCIRLGKGEARYQDIFEVGEEQAQALKEQGAEIVIALTHNRLAMDRELTQKCPSIDLLLGGHDHFYKKDLDKRVIKSGEEFQWLSEVQVTLDEGVTVPHVVCKTHAISSELPESRMINKLVQRYGEKMTEKMGKVIGKTTYPLDSTEEACRFKEGQLTNFLTDLMQTETGADCAVLGGAAVAGKMVLEPGVVTIGDVFNWFPDEIKIQVVEMSGFWLKEMLERSIRELPEEAPSFPHCSQDLAFTINMLRRPPCVENVRVKGEPCNPDAKYKVAVSDFVASGKERFKFIKEHCKVLTDAEHAEQFSLWILDFFRMKKGYMKDEPSPKPQARRRRRSSYAAESTRNELKLEHEGFELQEDDFAEVDLDTMRTVMIAMSHLTEETNSLKAQDFIKRTVRGLLDCDRATIFLVDHVAQKLRFIPDGMTEEIYIPISAGIVGVSATTGEVVNIPDAYQDSRFNQEVDKKTGYTTNNILACPVKKNDGTVVAVMQAVNKMSGSFGERDKRLLMMFGKQTAVQINHAEVFESLKKNEEATQTLLKIAKEISSDVSMDMKTMVACIMQGASQLMRCDRSSLFLVDSKNEEMWTVMVDPVTKNETIIRLPLGSGLSGHTAVTGNILNLKDAYDSPLFNQEWDKKTNYRTKSVLCVPIFTTEGSSDVLGVLQFINKLDGTAFSTDDEKMGFSFASFAGISIANTQEIDLLKLKNDDIVQEMPLVSMGRITVKGGWSTVRRLVKECCIHREGKDGVAVGHAFREVVQMMAQRKNKDPDQRALARGNTANFSTWIANNTNTAAKLDPDWSTNASSTSSDEA